MTTNRHAVYLQAKRYVEVGLSVIPIKLDGTKQPALKTWEPYKTRIADDATLRKWFFSGQAGIAIIGGGVSGNLERIDFDEPGIYQQFEELAVSCEFGTLLESLPLVETPRRGSGYHLYYRSAEPVEGNMPLARVPDAEGRPHTIIETRGEAGYTIAPGSPPTVHQIKHSYSVRRGDLSEIPTITADQRRALLEMARSFNEIIEPERVVSTRAISSTDNARPGDDYNARGDWRDILEAEGWKYVRSRGEVEYWRRPGKRDGISATWNHAGCALFYVFSSNAAPLESERAYDPFGLYATLKQGSDFSAAATALSSTGYGNTKHAVLVANQDAPVWFDPEEGKPLPLRYKPPLFEGLIPDRGFLADYCRYAVELTDAPPEFHLAAGLAIVSAALGNRVQTFVWGQSVYPNLWTLLLAPSGFYRKSTAINIALRILRGRVSQAILPDDFTREKLIDNLAANPWGVLPCCEFGELLAKLQRDYLAGTKEFLTAIYDGNDYKRTTKQGTVEITEPAVSILAASTIEWVHDRITAGDVRGGFLARFVFWPAQDKLDWKGITAPPEFSVVQSLQADLEILAGLSGVVVFDGELKTRYDDWVQAHEEEVNKRHLAPELQGFYTRLATYVLKFAMIYETAATRTVGVSVESLEAAIRLADYLKAHLVHLVQEEILTDRSARELRRVRDLIEQNPGVSKSELLRKAHMLVRALDEILLTLVESAEVVVQRLDTSGRAKQIFFVAGANEPA